MQHYQELPASAIIMRDHTCQNGEAERVLPIIEERMNDGNSLLVRKYNSLFFLTRLDYGKAEAHFYSIDKAIYAFKALKYFIEQTEKSGVDRLYICDFTDKSMERMLNMLDLTIQSSDKEGFKYMIDLQRGK